MYQVSTFQKFQHFINRSMPGNIARKMQIFYCRILVENFKIIPTRQDRHDLFQSFFTKYKSSILPGNLLVDIRFHYFHPSLIDISFKTGRKRISLTGDIQFYRALDQSSLNRLIISMYIK